MESGDGDAALIRYAARTRREPIKYQRRKKDSVHAGGLYAVSFTTKHVASTSTGNNARQLKCIRLPHSRHLDRYKRPSNKPKREVPLLPAMSIQREGHPVETAHSLCRSTMARSGKCIGSARLECTKTKREQLQRTHQPKIRRGLKSARPACRSSESK